MQETLNFMGYWWLPNAEENQLPGIFTFSQEDGAVLDIVGVLEKRESAKSKEPRIILGVTQHGKPITLYKCIPLQETYPILGFGGGKYYAHFVFEGVHFLSPDQIMFNRLLVQYDDLDAWVGRHGFSINTEVTDGGIVSKVNYRTPAEQLFKLDEEILAGIAFSSFGPVTSSVQTNVEISQRANLIVKSNMRDFMFDKLFAKLNAFSSLLLVAAQRMPVPSKVFGYSKENQEYYANGKIHYPVINIYYQPIEVVRDQKKKIPQEFLFTFDDLTDEQIVSWFLTFEEHKTVIQLYKLLFYKGRSFIEHKFLSIAQALESLHSVLFDNQNIPKDEFKTRRKTVLEAVPADLVDWVSGALNNANYKRFKSKIYELVAKKENILFELIDDFELFARRVKDTRNEFVHHNKQKTTFSKKELPSAIFVMTMIFEIYLLGLIGFSDEKVSELLEPKIKTHLTGWRHLRTKSK